MIIKDKVGVEIEQRPEVIQMGNGLNATSDGMGTATIALDVDGLTLTNTTTDNTISVDQNGNVGTDVATDGAIHIENTGNTGIGLGVYTNIGATADAELVSVHVDNVAFDEEAVKIVNDGVGIGVSVSQNGNAVALSLSSGATSANTVSIQNSGTGNSIYIAPTGDTGSSNAALKIVNTGNASRALYVTSANTDAQIRDLVVIEATNAAFDRNLLVLLNGGATAAVKITSSTNGAHINFTGDPSVTPADGDFWFDGTNLKVCVGSTVSTLDMTAV